MEFPPETFRRFRRLSVFHTYVYTGVFLIHFFNTRIYKIFHNLYTKCILRCASGGHYKTDETRNLFAVACNFFTVACNLFPVACNSFAAACNSFAVAFNSFTVACNCFPVACNCFSVACNLFAVACNYLHCLAICF